MCVFFVWLVCYRLCLVALILGLWGVGLLFFFLFWFVLVALRSRLDKITAQNAQHRTEAAAAAERVTKLRGKAKKLELELAKAQKRLQKVETHAASTSGADRRTPSPSDEGAAARPASAGPRPRKARTSPQPGSADPKGS